MADRRSITGHAAAFIAYAIFGFNIIVCKDLTSGHLIPPLGIFTLRSIIAGALFWLTSLFMPKEKIEKKDYIRIFAPSCKSCPFFHLDFQEHSAQIHNRSRYR